MDAELVGLSFSVEPGNAAYCRWRHRYDGAPEQLPLARVLEHLRPLLEDPERAKTGQNLKYDLHVLSRAGIRMQGVRYDTMLESYVLNSVGGRHNMDDLAKRYLGVDTIRYEDVAGKGAKQIGFRQVSVERAAEYAAEDADIALRLHQVLWPKLEAEPRLKSVYQEIELPLVAVLSRMECNGVLVDGAAAHRLQRRARRSAWRR